MRYSDEMLRWFIEIVYTPEGYDAKLVAMATRALAQTQIYQVGDEELRRALRSIRRAYYGYPEEPSGN